MSSAYTEARKRMHEQAAPPPAAPISHRCAANGCGLSAGLANPGGAGGWWCSYHFGAPAHDLPRITNVLAQNAALVNTIVEGRNALTDDSVAPDVAADLWRNARERLEKLGYDVPPPRGPGDDYRGWLYRVEMLLGAQVVQVRSFKRNIV